MKVPLEIVLTVFKSINLITALDCSSWLEACGVVTLLELQIDVSTQSTKVTQKNEQEC
jgi:hypothetical protein